MMLPAKWIVRGVLSAGRPSEEAEESRWDLHRPMVVVSQEWARDLEGGTETKHR